MFSPLSINAARQPLVYEINARCWLRELSQEFRKRMTFAEIPHAYFDHWMRLGITHIWLMGVWQTARGSVAFSRKNVELRRQWSRLLPGLTDEEITGSPYAIGGYRVCPSLGDDEGLQKFRERLHQCGIRLLLDFIPNHTGVDHSRVRGCPECYVNFPNRRPGTFRVTAKAGQRWVAHGKDPYFPPWADTAQLDLRLPETRRALASELKYVSKRCDGVRCDMAMLVLREIFERNWPPASSAAWEFWPEAIAAVKKENPDFLFLAEVYWDREQQLLDLGFDYVYDKRVYDLLIARKHAELQDLLCSRSPEFLGRACHFLENHDEERIASLLSPAEHRAAAALMLALPGMRLVHEGQLTGAKIRASVHLNRRSCEGADAEISGWYRTLIESFNGRPKGERVLKPFLAWRENFTAQNVVVIQSQADSRHGFDLTALNLASHASQCRVRPVMIDHPTWYMRSIFGNENFTHSGPELLHEGVYFDIPAQSYQAFRFTPTRNKRERLTASARARDKMPPSA